MSGSGKRAFQTDRSCLSEHGLARFEVLGRDANRDLIRLSARRLAEEGPESIPAPRRRQADSRRSAP